MSGYAAIHRDVRDHPLFKGNPERLGAWVWLILAACWKRTKFDVNGKIIILERGQVCTSMRHLATEWGWSKSTVERFLTRLKTETMIGTDSGTGRLVITICNYGKYQDQGKKGGTASGTASGTGAGQERDTKEEGKHLTREPNGSSPPIVPHHVPADLITDGFPVEAWNGWVEMREAILKKPLSPRAIKLNLNKLVQLESEGHCLEAVLDQSTMNNWQGLFAPKDKNQTRRMADDQNQKPVDGFTAALAEARDHFSNHDPTRDVDGWGTEEAPRDSGPPGAQIITMPSRFVR